MHSSSTRPEMRRLPLGKLLAMSFGLTIPCWRRMSMRSKAPAMVRGGSSHTVLRLAHSERTCWAHGRRAPVLGAILWDERGCRSSSSPWPPPLCHPAPFATCLAPLAHLHVVGGLWLPGAFQSCSQSAQLAAKGTLGRRGQRKRGHRRGWHRLPAPQRAGQCVRFTRCCAHRLIHALVVHLADSCPRQK